MDLKMVLKILLLNITANYRVIATLLMFGCYFFLGMLPITVQFSAYGVAYNTQKHINNYKIREGGAGSIDVY